MGADVAEQNIMQLSLENAATFCMLDIMPRYHQGEKVDVTWRSPETCTDLPDLLLVHPKEGSPTFSSCFQGKMTFLSNVLQGMGQEEHSDLTTVF